MTTTINKQRVLHQLFSALKKHGEVTEPENRPVLEQLVYAICRENATREHADRAYKRLATHFFDWNEVRVSSVHEVAEAMAGLSEPEQRAERIVVLLQEVFESTYSYDLESMHKKGVKQAVKSLGRYQAVNHFTNAWVVQQTLGGHAVPLDETGTRVVQRLGLIERDIVDREAMRTSLEHLVPKVKAPLFVELLSWIGQEYCRENEPRCQGCPLRGDCPTGQEQAAEASTSRARTKPR